MLYAVTRQEYFRSSLPFKILVKNRKCHKSEKGLKGHGSEPVFRGLCINRFAIGPLHYCTFRAKILMGTVGAQEYNYAMSILHNDYRVGLSM